MTFVSKPRVLPSPRWAKLKLKIKQIKLLSTASPGWGQRPFLDYIRPGVIKEILL